MRCAQNVVPKSVCNQKSVHANQIEWSRASARKEKTKSFCEANCTHVGQYATTLLSIDFCAFQMASRSRKRKVEESEEVKEEASKESKVDEKEGAPAGLEVVQQQQEGLAPAIEEDAGPMMLTRLEASTSFAPSLKSDCVCSGERNQRYGHQKIACRRFQHRRVCRVCHCEELGGDQRH